MRTFLWHDYETFGVDPRRDRPSQFAAVRTDLELNQIGAPLSIFCRLADDYLPAPEACVLTSITPRLTERVGLIESEFAATIFDAMVVPETIGVGYNSMRFDDEVSRHLFYRNLIDPYVREYANGNSRFDLIDLVRTAFALRPQGLNWPLRDDGSASFKLEALCRANAITQPAAHDALNDVGALVDLARLLKRAQPKLFAHGLKLTSKAYVRSLLDEINQQPVVHVSARFPARYGCLSMVAPVAQHPSQPNAIIVVDLRFDPSSWLNAEPDELRERMYSATADLPEDAPRVALKLIATNRAPMLAPLTVLDGADLNRIALDKAQCLRHAALIRQDPELPNRVRAAFKESAKFPSEDVDVALYDGFSSKQARQQMQLIRSLPAEALAQFELRSDDSRLPELLWRYRARNFPQSLSFEEKERWDREREARLKRAPLSPANFQAEIKRLRALHLANGTAQSTLDQLEIWALERHPQLFAG